MADAPKLAEALHFDPWWRHGDPVPPWLFQLLDRTAQIEIAVIGLQAQRAMLDAQIKAADAALQVIAKKR